MLQKDPEEISYFSSSCFDVASAVFANDLKVTILYKIKKIKFFYNK